MTATPLQPKSTQVPATQQEDPANNDMFNARTVVQTLEGLMVKVTEEDCSASTVNAACNCAARITDLLRVHLDVQRLQRKNGPK